MDFYRAGPGSFYEINRETVSVIHWRGPGYRLPMEAEWEYASRAGSTTRYSFGDAENELGQYAWYAGNSKIDGRSCTHPVGQKQCNGFGLFDMHGNVCEWCWDRYDVRHYQRPSMDDPRGAEGAAGLVIRGGSWNGVTQGARSAYRVRYGPGRRSSVLGFRVARVPSGR
jgi:formylglycine-generating enzyme required for sulfatase activity